MPQTIKLSKVEVLARYAAGESTHALAAVYDCAAITIQRKLRHWGAVIRCPGRTTKLPKLEILDRYAAGESSAALATAYGRSGATMRENLHRWGAAVRRRGPVRAYALNEDFFQSIRTEEQAYWLGFILADGSVNRTVQTCRIDLAVSDKDHLRKLATAVGAEAPIKLAHHGKSAYLDLCSAQLCRDLCALECGPCKTGNHGTPVVAEDLQRHFYRGYVDGDGSLFPVPQIHAWCFDTVGSTRFITEFQHWLIAHANVGKTKLSRARCVSDVSSVRYTGGPQIERIARLLYEGATVFLDRKYQSYLTLLRRPQRRTHNLLAS